MQYREDLIKLFQDFVNEHVGKVYFVGICSYGLPVDICLTDCITPEDYCDLQSRYLEYLQSNFGEYSIFGHNVYATEFFPHKLPNYDLLIERQVHI